MIHFCQLVLHFFQHFVIVLIFLKVAHVFFNELGLTATIYGFHG
jgi:hypothetical protein